MGLTAAVSVFVLVLLSVSVIHGKRGWGVTYSQTKICALKGSTVELSCTYRYPSTENGLNISVVETLWFIALQDKEPVNLRTHPEYAGRVEHRCESNKCTLKVTDLRESDSAVYKFRFITNEESGRFTGEPGVSLTVTGALVQRSSSTSCNDRYKWSEVKCQSRCLLPGQNSYVWYKNGERIQRKSDTYSQYFKCEDSISCAVEEHTETFSPSVCEFPPPSTNNMMSV